MNYFVDIIAKCFNNWLYCYYSFKFFDSFMVNFGAIVVVSMITLLFVTMFLFGIIYEIRR